MLNFILNRQADGKVTKISDLAKKFKMRTAEIWDVLDKGFEGYRVLGLENGASSNTVVSIEKVESEMTTPFEEVEEFEEVEYDESDNEEADADEEEAEDDGDDTGADGEETEDGDDFDSRDVNAEIEAATGQSKPKRLGFQAGIYPKYDTMEEALAAHPEGITTLQDAHAECCKVMKISSNKFLNAFGGDKMRKPVRNENWVPFTVGTSTRRYLSALVRNDFQAMQDEPVVRGPKVKTDKIAQKEALKEAREARKAEREAKKAEKAAKAEQAKAARAAERAAKLAAKKAAEADSGIPLLA